MGNLAPLCWCLVKPGTFTWFLNGGGNFSFSLRVKGNGHYQKSFLHGDHSEVQLGHVNLASAAVWAEPLVRFWTKC